MNKKTTVKKKKKKNQPQKTTKKNFRKKIIRFIDNLIDKAVFLVCLILFMLGSYGLYDSYMVYQQATDNSILKYKPGYETEEATNKEIKENMVAWITIDDTGIDYPVMQGEDNNEYLNKDPFGEYSLSGSIFLDSRNDPNFGDYYSLIYGHHMEQGMMFGALDEFLNEDYFNSHRNGTITVGEKTYEIRIFAVLECEATEQSIFAPTETDNTLNYVKQHALFLDDNALPKKNEKLIGLSTCKYPDTVERTLIFGALSPVEK